MTTDAFAPDFDPRTLPLGAIESPPDSRTLVMTNFLIPAEMPAIPEAFSNATRVNPWDMLGNDSKGDCVLVAYEHLCMLWSLLSGSPIRPTAAQVIALYLQLTGGVDSGLVIRDFLKFARANAILGSRKLQGFVSFDHRDNELMKIATFLFGGAGRGILLPDSAVPQTGPNGRWKALQNMSDPNNAPGSWGAHMTADIGYTPDTLETVTWGFVQPVDPNFYPAYSMEAYALIPTWQVPGFDYPKFYQALRDLGSDVDADPPDPTPPPPPPTPPAPDGETDYQALQRILGQVTAISHRSDVGGQSVDVVEFSKSSPWYYVNKGG